MQNHECEAAILAAKSNLPDSEKPGIWPVDPTRKAPNIHRDAQRRAYWSWGARVREGELLRGECRFMVAAELSRNDLTALGDDGSEIQAHADEIARRSLRASEIRQAEEAELMRRIYETVPGRALSLSEADFIERIGGQVAFERGLTALQRENAETILARFEPEVIRGAGGVVHGTRDRKPEVRP